MTDPALRWLLAAAFTASGFSALAYQVVWQRVLTQAIGSDSTSVVLVVTIFMACLGIGAELARRVVNRPGINLAVSYGLIELVVGIYGVFSVPLIRTANEWAASLASSSLATDSIINLLVLAPPIVGMGMTTPLIVQLAKRRLEDLGRVTGRLYGLNILGAAIGAVCTGLILIEALGLRGTTYLAAAINLMIAGALFLFLKSGQVDNSDVALVERPRTSIRFSYGLAAVAFGFGTLAMQIALFRVMVNYFTMASVVFPIVLAVYLLLMSAGQAVGGQLADRYPRSLPTVLAVLFTVGALLLLAALRFPPSWAADLGALSFTSFNGQLLPAEYASLVGDPDPVTIALFAAIFMTSVVAWSALFPVMLRIVTPTIEVAGSSFARLYTLYTVGNVLGTFLFGLAILPGLGTGTAVAAMIVITAAGALLAGGYRSVWTVAVTAVGVLAATLVPTDYYRSFRLAGYHVEQVYEGRNGVATVVPTSNFYDIIDMNRTASASAISRDPGPSDQYEAWRWNLSELMALDPSFRPRNVLIIGIGHAYLIDALLDHPFIEKITVVDISSEVITAVREHTKTSTARIFNDPRVDIVIADGRRYVQQALSRGEKFDLIQTKINEPWHAGSGNLFTVEFLNLQKHLLTPGGYLGVRPLAGHVRDGLEVFGAAVYPGFYHVYFRNGPLPDMRTAQVTEDIRDAWFRPLPGQAPIADRSAQLDVRIFNDKSYFDAIDPNTDDRPTFEYYWLRKTLGTWVTPRVPLDDERFQPLHRSVPVVVD